MNSKLNVVLLEGVGPNIRTIRLSPDVEVEMKVMREAVITYINQLNPSYRQIIAMKWIHNLSYKDMASELCVTEGVVRQRLVSGTRCY